MPFFADQSMILTHDHRSEFTDSEWRTLVRLPHDLGVPYLAAQQAGSGATVPEHAHVAVSTSGCRSWISPRPRWAPVRA